MAKQVNEPEEKVKTGYEETNENDTFGEIGGDEFELSDKDEEEKKEEEKKEEKQEEEKKEEPDELEVPEGEKEEEKKTDEEEKTEESEEKDEKEEENDGDLEIPDEDKVAVANKKIEKEMKLDWQAMGKEAGLEVEENSRESYISATKKAIEDSKQKVAFDTSNYNEETQEFIKFLENGGNYADLMNPNMKYYNFLSLPAKQKAKYHLMQEKDISEEEAALQVDDLADEGKLDEIVEKVDKNVKNAIQNNFNKIVSDSNENLKSQQKNKQLVIESEKKEILDLLEKTDKFMGRKLGKQVKAHLKSEIQTGLFFDKNNNAQAALNTRLYTMFGHKIISELLENSKEVNREGYNKGKEDVQADIHNIKTKQSAGAGAPEGSRQSDEVDDPLKGFTELDEDAIEV